MTHMDLAQPTPAATPAQPAPAAPAQPAAVAQAPAPAPDPTAATLVPAAAPSPVSVSLDLRGLMDATRPPPAAPPATPSAPPAPPADAPAPVAAQPTAPAQPAAQPTAPTAPATPDASAEVEKLRAQIRAKDIAAAVKDAARTLNVIDPDALHKLVSDHLTTNDRGDVVVIANPAESVTDYLARFCATRAYLLAPRMQPGAGAPPTVTPAPPPAPAPAINTAAGATAHLHGLLAARADNAVARFGGVFGPRVAPAPAAAPTGPR